MFTSSSSVIWYFCSRRSSFSSSRFCFRALYLCLRRSRRIWRRLLLLPCSVKWGAYKSGFKAWEANDEGVVERSMIVAVDPVLFEIRTELSVVLVVTSVDEPMSPLPSWMNRRQPRTKEVSTNKKRILNVSWLEKCEGFYSQIPAKSEILLCILHLALFAQLLNLNSLFSLAKYFLCDII